MDFIIKTYSVKAFRRLAFLPFSSSIVYNRQEGAASGDWRKHIRLPQKECVREAGRATGGKSQNFTGKQIKFRGAKIFRCGCIGKLLRHPIIRSPPCTLTRKLRPKIIPKQFKKRERAREKKLNFVEKPNERSLIARN